MRITQKSFDHFIDLLSSGVFRDVDKGNLNNLQYNDVMYCSVTTWKSVTRMRDDLERYRKK